MTVYRSRAARPAIPRALSYWAFPAWMAPPLLFCAFVAYSAWEGLR